ncbi:MAG: inosine monophosphate dehydrogenase [Candidatus Methanoperedens nitroreducens]|uniref:Inosine monophosphate dehydrogenase n=1 Tax=Candidatus Methanoperedens nitratireducens TaxID=1392998 RepID=A0A0P8C6Q6_9EURY|nr:CBS domain-containing protein [Candidatus Methanoperedens sp. BLZ2]KAB2948303.1 MAG: CBS domain-containing protein [Candidatus Methanoperedens sp.]KPQ42427.1 MAG: inosine monophosphate dehydrogenase [Candidatus Methanoperedens sp. BLZ1]MBZ0174854.1 CBS domain-containing protein [Candidatus Methanoperedens nitroreducens]MCX9077007.1 CBS domain-containing protein [Candidatus Methanoperedens sp.]MCX9089768.1 CBS domain-containing protein [Candidatus Methanoperedens sp.]
MKIKDIMSAPVFVVSPDENVARARNLMLRHKIGRLVIVENNKPIGMVTKKDIVKRLNQAEPQWRRRPIDDIPVRKVMTESLITIFPDATPRQLAELMTENNIGGLPVVNNKDEVIGIATKWDLIRYFSKLDLDMKVKDLQIDPALTVHRHHTISHIIHELQANSADRAIVLEDNDMPVGIITNSNLTFTEMRDKTGGLPQKEIKMTRKESAAGRKQNRYISEVPLVAEDIMSSPIINVNYDDLATYAAGLMIKKRINGLSVLGNGVKGILTGENIIKTILTM